MRAFSPFRTATLLPSRLDVSTAHTVRSAGGAGGTAQALSACLQVDTLAAGGAPIVQYVGNGLGYYYRQAASVRTDLPVPGDCPLYYYEVTVLDDGEDGSIGLGFAAASVPLSRLPGWDEQSYGYHGDDGNKFTCHGRGSRYGPRYGTNDVVGALWDRTRHVIEFFRNGEGLGVAFADVPNAQVLYPMVGLRTRGAKVSVNLGPQAPGGSPFRADVRAIERCARQVTLGRIHSARIARYDDPWDGDARMHQSRRPILVVPEGDDGEYRGGIVPNAAAAAVPRVTRGSHRKVNAGGGKRVRNANGGGGVAGGHTSGLMLDLVLEHLLAKGMAGTAAALAHEAGDAVSERLGARRLESAVRRQRIMQDVREGRIVSALHRIERSYCFSDCVWCGASGGSGGSGGGGDGGDGGDGDCGISVDPDVDIGDGFKDDDLHAQRDDGRSHGDGSPGGAVVGQAAATVNYDMPPRRVNDMQAFDGQAAGPPGAVTVSLLHWRLRLQLFLGLVVGGAPYTALEFARQHLRRVTPPPECTAWGLQLDVLTALQRNGEGAAAQPLPSLTATALAAGEELRRMLGLRTAPPASGGGSNGTTDDYGAAGRSGVRIGGYLGSEHAPASAQPRCASVGRTSSAGAGDAVACTTDCTGDVCVPGGGDLSQGYMRSPARAKRPVYGSLLDVTSPSFAVPPAESPSSSLGPVAATVGAASLGPASSAASPLEDGEGGGSGLLTASMLPGGNAGLAPTTPTPSGRVVGGRNMLHSREPCQWRRPHHVLLQGRTVQTTPPAAWLSPRRGGATSPSLERRSKLPRVELQQGDWQVGGQVQHWMEAAAAAAATAPVVMSGGSYGIDVARASCTACASPMSLDTPGSFLGVQHQGVTENDVSANTSGSTRVGGGDGNGVCTADDKANDAEEARCWLRPELLQQYHWRHVRRQAATRGLNATAAAGGAAADLASDGSSEGEYEESSFEHLVRTRAHPTCVMGTCRNGGAGASMLPLKELQDALALLAYTDPWVAPAAAHLLGPAAREALAEQLNEWLLSLESGSGSLAVQGREAGGKEANAISCCANVLGKLRVLDDVAECGGDEPGLTAIRPGGVRGNTAGCGTGGGGKASECGSGAIAAAATVAAVATAVANPSRSPLEGMFRQCAVVWDELAASFDCPEAMLVEWRAELRLTPPPPPPNPPPPSRPPPQRQAAISPHGVTEGR